MASRPGLQKKGMTFVSTMHMAFDKDGTDTGNEAVEFVTNKINSSFPGAIQSDSLAEKVEGILSSHGYTRENSILATSLCCDEVNRDLEDDLRVKFNCNFSMGGLAGFPFCGMTSFGAMAHHIPTGGSCLVVYGPHVGVDLHGCVGKVNRRGREGSGACCGSANAALAYVEDVRSGARGEAEIPDDYIDAQQVWIQKTLLEYGEQIEKADEKYVELPNALFTCQDKFMKRIVDKAAGEVAGEGKIALLGGIQINTPAGVPEFFLPKKFDLLNNKGEVVASLLEDLMG